MVGANTFSRYSLIDQPPGGVYEIGRSWGNGTGAIEEISKVFGHKLTETPDPENLRELCEAVAPDELAVSSLIERIKSRYEFYYGSSEASGRAINTVNRAGLLDEVHRHYMTPGDTKDKVGVAIIAGGLITDTFLRTKRLYDLASQASDIGEESFAKEALIVVRHSPILPTVDDLEHRVSDKTHEEMYAKFHLGEGMLRPFNKSLEQIDNIPRPAGFKIDVEAVDLGNEELINEEVLIECAAEIVTGKVPLDSTRLAVMSEPGNWPYIAGQFRRAMHKIRPSFDEHDDQLVVSAGMAELGTGYEPPLYAYTHNPFLGVARIVRNAHELSLHGAERS